MPNFTITLTTDQATGITAKNAGAYPTDALFVAAIMGAHADQWKVQADKDTDAVLLGAVKADPILLASAQAAVVKK